MQTSSQLDNPFQPLLNQQRTTGGKSAWKGETAICTLCNKAWFQSPKKDFQGFPCLPLLPGGRFPVSRSRLHGHRVCIMWWWRCVCSWHWGALTLQSSSNDSGNLSSLELDFQLPLLQFRLTAQNTRLFCGKNKKKRNPLRFVFHQKKNGFTALRTQPCFSNTGPKQ